MAPAKKFCWLTNIHQLFGYWKKKLYLCSAKLKLKIEYTDMDKNVISLEEHGNDGKSVFLYYDAMAGVYLAYGLSAYYTTMVTDPYMSYSEEMQMPVALLRRNHINDLRQSLRKVAHTVKTYYRFELKAPVGDAGYERWSQNVIAKHSMSIK